MSKMYGLERWDQQQGKARAFHKQFVLLHVFYVAALLKVCAYAAILSFLLVMSDDDDVFINHLEMLFFKCVDFIQSWIIW